MSSHRLGNYSTCWRVLEGRLWTSLLAKYIANHIRLLPRSYPRDLGDSDILRETKTQFFRAIGELGSRMNTRIRKLHIIFVGYAAVVITISLMPSDDITVAAFMDKVFHFTMYFFMALLALVAFQTRWSRVLALMFTYGLGFMLEWGQGFVADRTPSMTDNLANILGATLGIILFLLWQKFNSNRLEEQVDSSG